MTGLVTAAVVLLALLLFAALVIGARLFVGDRQSSVNSRLRSRVVVTLKSGAAFDGVLFEAGRAAWVLRSAHALGAGENGDNVAVDGEVLILTGDIDFAQRP